MTTNEPESGVGPRYQACLTALKQWRDGLVREAKLPLGGIKDTDLHRAITRGHRDERRVAGVLPATYRRFAVDIVALIGSTDAALLAASAERATERVAERVAPSSVPNERVEVMSASSGPHPADPPPPPTASARPMPAGPTGTPPAGRRPDFAVVDPGPPPAPVAPNPVTPERRVELARIADQFARYDFSVDHHDPGPLKVNVDPGRVVLTWEPSTAPGGVVYRVVATDDYEGIAPEFAELIDITQDETAVDTRPFISAIRFYQVWRNSGSTPVAAMAAQPQLHAQRVVVVGVQDLGLQEDGGRVIGQWTVFPGVTRVHVYRMPIERAAQFRNGDPQFAVAADSTNLSGFVDRTAVRGQRYLYLFFAEAAVDGVARLSDPVREVRLVSAVLTPVEDLAVTSRGGGAEQQFDLTWTAPPAGRVVLYRTPSGPTAGLENETRDEATLEAFGLKMDLRLRHPTQRGDDGVTTMTDIPTPLDWERVYFTPVTLIDGKARVGRTVSKVVIGQVDHPVVVERTNHQVVKFGWPGEAAAVAVSLGARGKPATLPQEGPTYLEISRDHYRRLGGLQLPRSLPAEGCSVHLAGISFVRGERVYGNPSVADYPGLARLYYSVEFKRTLMHNPDRAYIRVWAEREVKGSPPFVLVHNADRLPLSVNDGESLDVVLDVDEVTQPQRHFKPPQLDTTPSSTPFRAHVRGRRTGFFRVFVDVPPDRLRELALIDPPVHTLTPRD